MLRMHRQHTPRRRSSHPSMTRPQRTTGSPEYESSSPWLEQGQSAPAAEARDIGALPDSHAAADERPAADQVPKHVSTVSLRAPSHTTSIGDGDDDDEWNLPRTGTDPFEFMGPSDRTNSFPAVPPVTGPTEHDEDCPSRRTRPPTSCTR